MDGDKSKRYGNHAVPGEKKKMGKVRIHHVSLVQANKCNIHLFIPAENTTLAH